MKEKEQSQTDLLKNRTREYATRLWSLVGERLEKQVNDEKRVVRIPPPKSTSRLRYLVNLLYIFPFLLLLCFSISFFWDFNDLNGSFYGHNVQFEGLLRILSISGLIGYLTNWVAIKMLFKPTHRRPLLGQGLIPAQKERIAYRLALAVSEDLINPDIIKTRIQESNAITRYREKATNYVKTIIDDPTFRTDLKVLVVSYVDEMISDPEVRAGIAGTVIRQIEGAIEQNSLERVALKAYSFIKGREMQEIVEQALENLPAGVEKGLDKLDDFLDDLPERIEQNSGSIEDIVTNLLYKLINQLDVHALVEDNLRQYDEQRLETMIRNASNDQLRYIQYLGALLGTFGGFVIWEPLFSLAVILMIILVTFGLDTLISRLQEKP